MLGFVRLFGECWEPFTFLFCCGNWVYGYFGVRT